MTVQALTASEISDRGVAFQNIDKYEETKGWLDQSFSWIIPTTGVYHSDVYDSWDCIDFPMNQARTGRLRAKGMEVGDAYNFLVRLCIDEDFCSKHYNPEYAALIQSTRFIWTTEQDNPLPPNTITGLMSSIYTCPDCAEPIGGRLVRRSETRRTPIVDARPWLRRAWDAITMQAPPAFIERRVNIVAYERDDDLMDRWECANGHHGYDAVSGLYFTKGMPPRPMAYGDPANGPDDFRPRSVKDAVEKKMTIEVNGIALGCSLWRKDIFRNLSEPWFETIQTDNMAGSGGGTQDLVGCRKAKQELGARFGVNCNVRVGHINFRTGMLY